MTKASSTSWCKGWFNTIVMNYIRQRLSESNPDINEVLKKASSFNKDKWTDDVKRLFRQAAPGVIHLNENEDQFV